MEEVRVKDALGGKGYNQKFEWPINFASEEKKISFCPLGTILALDRHQKNAWFHQLFQAQTTIRFFVLK